MSQAKRSAEYKKHSDALEGKICTQKKHQGKLWNDILRDDPEYAAFVAGQTFTYLSPDVRAALQYFTNDLET